MKTSGFRKFLLALAALLVVAVAVLVWAVATFDANAYKGRAIDWVKTHRDRTLVIDGPLKLSVFPRIALQVSQLRLSEKGRADEFLALDRASLSLALWPLLRQKVVVDGIDARGLRINYQRNAEGASNLDDWLAPAADDKPTSGAPAAERAPHVFDIRSVSVYGLKLRVRDEQAKLAGEITLNSLTTGRIADAIESPVALDAQFDLQSPALKGTLTGSTALTWEQVTRSLRLRDMAFTWQGDALGVQAIDATLKGSLVYDAEKGSVQAQGLDLGGAATLGALKLEASRLTLSSADWQPSRKSLALAQLQLRLVGSHAGHPLTLALEAPQFGLNRDAVTGSALSGKLSLQGPAAVEASFKSAAPTGSWDRLMLPRVEANLTWTSGPRKLGGMLRTDLVLQPPQSVVALKAIDAQLELQQPGAAALKLSVKGKAEASAQSAEWALAGQIDGADFSSDGSAILATDPITLKLGARFAALDLNRLFPAAGGSATVASSAPAASASGDTPIDLSALRSLQGEFHLRVGQLAYQRYRIADAALDATLEGGMLKADQIAGKAWGGALRGSAFADARASRVALKGTATDIDIQALLKDVAEKDLLEGKGQVTLDIDTAGRAVQEMKSRLQGTAALKLRDGAIKGINLAKSLRQAKAALKMQPTSQAASSVEKTDFSELSASFVLKDGVASSTDLDVKSPFLRLGGDGQIDIGQSRIDDVARASVTNTSKGQDGADLAALKGLTIPVRLSGPLDAVQWSIQWSALATAALKSEVGAKLEDELKAKLRDKLGSPAAPSAASAASASNASEKDKLKKTLKGLLK